MTKPDTSFKSEELRQLYNEFEAWIDGFMHGAKLEEEPFILNKVKCFLGDAEREARIKEKCDV